MWRQDLLLEGEPCMFDTTPCTAALPSEVPATPGEAVHLAYWLVNDTGSTETLSFTAGALSNGGGTIPASAVEVRVLTYVNTHRWWFQTLIPWEDQQSSGAGDGFPDVADWDVLCPNTLGTPTWFRETRNNGSGGACVHLERWTDPLPLMLKGAGTSQEIDVPSGEARALWVTIRVPSNTATGAYSGNVVTISGPSAGDQSIPLTVNVPCWDTLAARPDELRLWDYSYEAGDDDNETDGITNTTRSDARAQVREESLHNSIYWPIGVESRDLAATSTPLRTEFSTFVGQLADDLFAYQTLVSRDSTTIVLGMAPNKLYATEWGDSTTTPEGDWSIWYEQLLVDLESELGEYMVEVDDYRWVIMPADEPVDGTQDPPTSKSGTKGFNLDGTQVDRVAYFGAAASVIREFTPSDGLDLEIAVTHPWRPDWTDNVSWFESNLEDCGHASGDCVDIWVQRHVPASQTVVAHGLVGNLADEDDEAWLYEDSKGPAEWHRSSAWYMVDHGYTGAASWAFSSANPKPGYSGYVDSSEANSPYVSHMWSLNYPPLWNQYEQAYDPDTSTDTSAPSWVATNEELVPGRVHRARGQALEYHRAYTHLLGLPGLDDGGYLDDLIEEASMACHAKAGSPASGTLDSDVTECTGGEADSHEVNLVIRHWIDEYHACQGAPTSTSYSGSNQDVLDALSHDPW